MPYSGDHYCTKRLGEMQIKRRKAPWDWGLLGSLEPFGNRQKKTNHDEHEQESS